MSENALRLTNVRKSFGDVEVINGVDFEIRSGEFVVFVGPSGCGKSTLLRMIAGLEDITAGTVEIGGAIVNERPPSKRGIAMVFQSYALYPHMNVFDNMAFGMKLAKLDKAVIDRRVREAADILQLTPYLKRLPKQLSGGQRQRVAIGRAIVRDPKVFLFDEPLSNLDAALRVATRIEIAKLARSMPDTTMIYVTHDQIEALTLADRIVVLNAGRIEQVGTPMDLYHTPANLFVARFIGSPAMNTVPCRVEAATGGEPVAVLASGRRTPFAAETPSDAAGTSGTLGVRPENLRQSAESAALFSGTVDIVEALGEVTLVYLDIGAAEPLLAKLDGRTRVEYGQTLHLTAAVEDIHVFDGDGRAFRRNMPPLAA